MRHRDAGRKLGRNSSHRDAMWRNMVTSIIEHGKVRTTEPKAKELRRFAERTITRGISVHEIISKPVGERSKAEQAKVVHAYRMAARMIRTREVLTKLFTEVALKFKDRPGGYLRITRLAPRPGDGAPMALVEFV